MRTAFKTLLACGVFLCLSIPARGADAPEKIRIGYPAMGTVISAQVGLSLEKTEILKRKGFDAKVVPMATGRDLKIALVGDKVDVILTSEANFVVLLAEGFAGYGVASLGEAGEMGLSVKAASPVAKVEDLKGKTVATLFGTSVHPPAIEWTRGVPDVKVVGIANTSAIISALETEKIVAAMLWDPFMTDLQDKGAIRVLKRAPLDLVVVASKEFVDSDPTSLRRFQEALREAVLYFNTHADEVNGWWAATSKVDATLIDKISHVNRNYAKRNLEEIDISISPAFADKMQRIGAFLFESKIINSNPDIRTAIRNPK